MRKQRLNLLKSRKVLITILLLLACAVPVLVGQLAQDSETVEYSNRIILRDVADFEAVFLEHQFDYLWIVPPFVEFILVQPCYAPLFFDPNDFPKTFSDNLIGEYTKEGIPEYEVRVYEDPTTREIKFVNDANQLLEALAAPMDYNPYSYVSSFYPALYTSSYSDTERDWLKALYDPSRVQGVFWLIPLEYADQYMESVKKQMLRSKPGRIKDEPIVRRSSGSSNELWLAISNMVDGGNVEISINVPTGIQTNHLEIYTTEDLLTFWWDIAASNLVAGLGTNVITWTHDASAISNKTVLYYTAGNVDVDSDGDDLADTHERFLHHTDPEDPDTDGDLLPDGWEVLAALDPLSAVGINGTLGDADDDGLSNWEEWTVGTDPNTFDSVIVLGPNDLYEEGGAKMAGPTPGVLYRSISTQRSKCGFLEFVPTNPPRYYARNTKDDNGSWTRSGDDNPCIDQSSGARSRHEESVWDPDSNRPTTACSGTAEAHWTNNVMPNPPHPPCSNVWLICNTYGSWNSDCSEAEINDTGNTELWCISPYYFPENIGCSETYEPLIYQKICSGTEGGTTVQRELVEELSNEYTKGELITNALADLSGCTTLTNVPWGSGVYSVFPAGYSCSTGSAATAACRNLSTNEYQINLTRLGYCFQVTNLVPNQIYRLNWAEYFTPEDSSNGVVQNIRTDVIRGNGLLQFIAENTGVIDPPDENGLIEPVVFKISLDVDSDYDGDIDQSDEGLKVSSGGMVSFNQDDDNDNGTNDWQETGLVSGENDLRIIQLDVHVDDLETGTVTLDALSGGERIEIWESYTNSTPLDLPKVWDVVTNTIPTNLYVEGVGASTNWRDVNLRLRLTSYTNNCDSEIVLTVVNTDLDIDSDYDTDIDEIDDPIEISAGGLICVNQDDDNGNGKPDKDDTQPVSDEDDLRPIHIKLSPIDLSPGVLKLEAVSGGTKIRMWASSNKVQAVSLPKTWANSISVIPTNLYVEGFEASATMRDVELKLGWTSGTNVFSDSVKLTVIKVDMVNAWESDSVCNRVPNRKQTTPNRLFVATEGSGNVEITVKASIQPDGIEDKVLCAVYDGSTHLASASFASSDEAILNFTPTGAAKNYVLKIGVDGNNSGTLESSEFCTTVTNFDVTAFTSAHYNDERSDLESLAWWADAGGYNVGATLLFRFLNIPDRPCPFDNNTSPSINCFTQSNLTHNAGATFSSSGAGTLDEHVWNAASEASYKIANSEEARDAVNTILAAHGTEITGYFSSHPTETSCSTNWTHFDVGINFDEENYLPMSEYDLHVAFGHAMLSTFIVSIVVEKDSASNLHISTLVLTGTLVDLYDFDYEAGGLNSQAAAIQIGWDTAVSGRDAGNIFFDRTYFQDSFTSWIFTF